MSDRRRASRCGGTTGRLAASLWLAAALGCGAGGPKSGVSLTTETWPAAGNPAGQCAVPAGAGLEDTSHPTTVVGSGTPESCTPAALLAAIHDAGVVTFDCGPAPVTITLASPIEIVNDSGVNKDGDTVIDGGGKVTLSGGGATRILYQNGCDESLHWITSHCQDYDHPRLVVQNLTFADGYAPAPVPTLGFSAGGAIYAESGLLKIVNCVFVRNAVSPIGPDVAGAAVYSFMQAGPVYVVNSTFGGAPGLGNVGSNGGALGSIGVSYTVLNSVMTYNQAIGWGENPATNGPGGGSGGAIYNDGDTYTLTICGSDVSNNSAKELGGAVFYVSDDNSGSVAIEQSTFAANACQAPQNPKGFYVQTNPANVSIDATNHIE